MRMQLDSKALLLAMTATLTLGLSSSAFADQTPTPAPDASHTALEQYRIDRENYVAAIKLRNASIKNINIAFKAACDKATSDFKSAMAVARTPEQKNAAVSARKSAVSAAIATRDASIAGLGAEPVAPIEPPKPIKVPGKNKSR